MGITSSVIAFDASGETEKKQIFETLKFGKSIVDIKGIKSQQSSNYDIWMLFFSPDVFQINNKFLMTAML
jgi:hypothetical protein